ncbi:MAG: prolipoprotein diacylglyceryl transferase [Clostridia bacterium]|nr:prolipoprotein diacylglyceryl transferase [Clostridia bacterium]
MPEIYFPHLGIKINHLSRVAISIFGFNIYWYAVIITTAILIGYFSIDYLLKKQGKSIDDFFGYVASVLIFSVIGARTYFVIFSWDYYKNNLLEIFALRNGGIAIYGGVIGAIITTIVYCKIKKINFFYLADLFAPFLALGQCMGRWGNFFNREAFGGVSDSLFSMALRLDTVRELPASLANQTVNYFNAEYIQVQPTFLYESICTLIIFIILLYMYNHKHFLGEVFISYITLYSFARFFVEGLRTDQLLICNVPISQIVAVLLFITGIFLFIKMRKNEKIDYREMNKNINSKNKNKNKKVKA